MSDQDMITAILNYIQEDENLLSVIRLSATRNIPNLTTDQLTMIVNTLNIPVTPGS